MSLALTKPKSGRIRAPIGKPPKGTRKALHIEFTGDTKKTALEAAALGMSLDKVAVLIGFRWGDDTGFRNWLAKHPEAEREIRDAQVRGEFRLQSRIHDAENGWQGAAWLLERTRGYVAKASIEHTGKGGSALTIAHQVLTAVGEKEK